MSIADVIRGWWRPAFAPVTGHARDWLLVGDGPQLPLEIDAAGWLLGPGVERFPSVRHSPLKTPHGPVAVVWHATSCPPGTPLWKRIQTYDAKKDRAASWHVIVEADGSLYQSIPFELGAWHCSAGMIDGEWRTNACSVGIELAAEERCERPGYVWPGLQVQAAERLVRALAATYPIAQVDHYAHSALDPARRGDPGPTWMKAMLPMILHKVYGDSAGAVVG